METKEYERLTSAYLDCIYRVAINGCKSYTDAEDVVQNTFIKLWEKENRFENDDHARKWLIRVAVNECNSFWRSPLETAYDISGRTVAGAGIFFA